LIKREAEPVRKMKNDDVVRRSTDQINLRIDGVLVVGSEKSECQSAALARVSN
jgi:hypothetical protein